MTDVLSMIDSELSRASQPRASRRPVFLFLKAGQKALIRPLYNLDATLVLPKHSRWHQDRDYRVNAICATEIDRPCQYCQQAKDDKKLSTNMYFYLPVYVYSVTDTHTGQHVTYIDPETQQEKPVAGIRLLELSSFGTISSVLKFFRSFYQDPDNRHDIRICDFSIEQVGEGQKKDFVVMVKSPRSMPDKIKAIIPTPDVVRQRILEACPPLCDDDDDTPVAQPGKNGNAAPVAASDNNESEDDDIPAF